MKIIVPKSVEKVIAVTQKLKKRNESIDYDGENLSELFRKQYAERNENGLFVC